MFVRELLREWPGWDRGGLPVGGGSVWVELSGSV